VKEKQASASLFNGGTKSRDFPQAPSVANARQVAAPPKFQPGALEKPPK
jgi:hypothetical protein